MSAPTRARRRRQPKRDSDPLFDRLRYVDLLLEKLDDETIALIVWEVQRRERIAQGLERGCSVCGCSETRACRDGCVWAREDVCSRCV